MNNYKQLFKFFNQYIHSNEISIAEQLTDYFREYDVDHHHLVAKQIREFLNEDFALSEKENLIQSQINIKLDTKRHNPMLLLTSILASIETRIAKIEKREEEQAQLLRKYQQLTSFLTRFNKCTRSKTPEDILNHYFNTTQPEEWRELEQLIREFLAEEISKRKQNAIINQFVTIDFHYRNTTPNLWLKGVANSIIYRLKWLEIEND